MLENVGFFQFSYGLKVSSEVKRDWWTYQPERFKINTSEDDKQAKLKTFWTKTAIKPDESK